MPTATRLERVMVPLDGSSLSERALAVIEPLARAWEAEVFLVEGVEGFAMPVPDAPRQGLRLRHLRPPGPPRQTLVQTAREEGIEAIAIGSHGRQGVARMLQGSMAEHLLRSAPCPVLVVHDSTPVAPEGGFRRVVVPFDGTRRSLEVLSFLPPWLHPEARLVLVQATNQPTHPSLRDQMEESLQRLRLDLPAPELVRTLEEASADQAILEVCERYECDLIAMATHGRGGFWHALLGSVTEQVSRRAKTPVLGARP